MHRLNYASFLGGLTVAFSVCGSAQLHGQTTVFQTGFEYESEGVPVSPSDLNGAIGQIGSWSGDEFPAGIGSLAPESVGFEDHPDNGSRLLWLDRPTTSDGVPGREVLSFFAELSEPIFTAGATFSFEGGTRRTGGNHNKDWDLIGLDSSGNEAFHLTVDADAFQGLGYVTAGTAVYELPTIVGEAKFGDLPNIGGTPFDNDEIGKITVTMGTNGYFIDLSHGRNSYTTDILEYNGPATELSRIQITYSASDNTGLSSGYVLDNLLVSGRKVSEGALTQGDFNSDGNIDMADFGILAANYNTRDATFERGDNNFDTRVNITDFLEWRAIFQAQVQGAAVSSVPEPKTFFFVICGLFALPFLRRHRRV